MHKLKMSTRKRVIIEFKDKLMIRAKMVIDSNVLQQISHFRYLGHDIIYTLER
jgi:hypothetical protein